MKTLNYFQPDNQRWNQTIDNLARRVDKEQLNH